MAQTRVDERSALLASAQPTINGDEPAKYVAGAGFAGLPWWKRPSIYWVIPPLLPFTIAFGGVAVPKINLILTLICRDYLSERAALDPTFTYLPVVFGADNEQCRIPEVQALVSRFQLMLNLIAGALAAIASPKLGVLSDGYGRTKIIALATFGTLLGEVVTVMVAARPDVFSLNFLLLGATFDGLFGSVTTAVALTQSYAADCVAPERRNVAFGYFHGVLFSGIALGPFIAGYLIKLTNNVLIVFYSVLACQVLFLVSMSLIVPESLSKQNQESNRQKRNIRLFDASAVRWKSWRNLNPLSLLRPLSILFPREDRTRPSVPGEKKKLRDVRRNLIILSAIDTSIFGVAMSTMGVLIIYAEYMFGWGNFQSSMLVSMTSTVRVAILLAILPTLTRLFRKSASKNKHKEGSDMLDIVIIRISVLFDMLGYLGYCLVRSGPLLMLSGATAAMGAMASPTLQSSLTKHVPAEQTGQLLGAIGLLHALARVVAPTIFNMIYSLTVRTVPQTVFICLSGLIFVAFISSWFLKPHVFLQDAPSSTVEPEDLEDVTNVI
ncbi:hypothetical protein LOZ61_006440 [Ophidiomyces ophidiicola]|uniref:uncharacterized protein n=1 Tax=Ophidiomyces ophidiicola TaxID=1387563 RepID=UPI0020C4FCDA|nr:uncharacterized protein LOZ57_001049 [Ophidiomyces ophidiicola]KAI1906882.1 hypothetical protein LOZ61_006440 [Ophidiomyces ophidiicola]KAI1922305.1 hypothetical protein LOZ60_005789 [Ophidiomyces ophidiicola]KAI1951397.1 hypothetical protein LOZ59_005653 [Ophidiomyces ophidiicola]KAI1952965.1 hypothetical protein LOZ57_001049 [Ophidiomyces ophidiicola]KAI2006244.1 hypothetical protein LOZ49_005099 [Ophidiomyces ophidiicola]